MPSRPLLAAALFALALPAAAAEPLPDTKPLTEQGDLAAKMVEGIDKYLMREIAASVENRKQYWKVDFSSPEAYLKSVQPNRDRLKKILGVVDERVPFTDLEYVGGPKTPSLVAETDDYKVFAVRWPVLPGVDGEGLLLEPKGKVRACVVAVPDADWTPEMLVGLAAGVPEKAQFARRLAENGCRVLVPTLIDRKDDWSGNPDTRPHDKPAAPRVHLPHGLRGGPARHRIRDPKSLGRGGLVLPGQGPSAGRSSTATARAVCWRSTPGPSTSGSAGPW